MPALRAARKAAAAQEPLHTLAVPCGVDAAVQVMGDAIRTHDPSLRRLLDWFATQRAVAPAAQVPPGTQIVLGTQPATTTRRGSVPSPLPLHAWRTVLGVDPSHPDPGLGHVLASHDAAPLYVARLRMSPATRAALVSDPSGLRPLLPHASALAVVAPVLERDEDGWLLPGGASARPRLGAADGARHR